MDILKLITSNTEIHFSESLTTTTTEEEKWFVTTDKFSLEVELNEDMTITIESNSFEIPDEIISGNEAKICINSRTKSINKMTKKLIENMKEKMMECYQFYISKDLLNDDISVSTMLHEIATIIDQHVYMIG